MATIVSRKRKDGSTGYLAQIVIKRQGTRWPTSIAKMSWAAGRPLARSRAMSARLPLVDPNQSPRSQQRG